MTDVAGAAGMLDWRDMDRGAPELARLGLARLAAARLAMLGTLRRDGSPRISPVEPCIVDGQLLAGAMTWSGKAADLRQDPRYVLHSVVAAQAAARVNSSSAVVPWRPIRVCAGRLRRGGQRTRRGRRSCSRCVSARRCSSPGTLTMA